MERLLDSMLGWLRQLFEAGSATLQPEGQAPVPLQAAGPEPLPQLVFHMPADVEAAYLAAQTEEMKLELEQLAMEQQDKSCVRAASECCEASLLCD